MKRGWFLGIFLTFILLILAGGTFFYWYEWRPMKIRQECTSSIEKKFYDAWRYGQENYERLGNEAFAEQSRLDYIGRSELRKRCLEEHGLR